MVSELRIQPFGPPLDAALPAVLLRLLMLIQRVFVTNLTALDHPVPSLALYCMYRHSRSLRTFFSECLGVENRLVTFAYFVESLKHLFRSCRH